MGTISGTKLPIHSFWYGWLFFGYDCDACFRYFMTDILSGLFLLFDVAKGGLLLINVLYDVVT